MYSGDDGTTVLMCLTRLNCTLEMAKTMFYVYIYIHIHIFSHNKTNLRGRSSLLEDRVTTLLFLSSSLRVHTLASVHSLTVFQPLLPPLVLQKTAKGLFNQRKGGR